MAFGVRVNIILAHRILSVHRRKSGAKIKKSQGCSTVDKNIVIEKGGERYAKVIGRLNTAVMLLVIAGVLVFWGQIPGQVPRHYGIDGKADAWSDKSILILLLFMIVILNGVLWIINYYIKTSLTSKYTADYEKKTFLAVYGMLQMMQLGITVAFAYIVLCTATGKNLGIWFLPIFIAVCVLPLAVMIINIRKNNSSGRQQKKQYKIREKSEKGVVYRSKIDWWLGGICIACLFVPLLNLADLFRGEMLSGGDWLGFLISFLCIWGLILPLFLGMKYTCYDDYLKIKCAYWGTLRIPYDCITGMTQTWSLLSSAALSVKRIQIDYCLEGKHGFVYISPVRKDEFMMFVKEKRGK